MNQSDATAFDLDGFLPYLLNQTAEAASRGFQKVYRERFGLTRTQWRVMANIGKFGDLTARDICAVSMEEKTNVSRAVAALELRGLLVRRPSPQDKRAELLALTGDGCRMFDEIGRLAQSYDASLRAGLGPEEAALLDRLLRRLKANAAPPAETG